MPYRYIPIIEAPPSPWAMFLHGLGQGLTGGMEQAFRQRENLLNIALQQRNALAQKVLTDLSQGNLDPRFLLTEPGQAVLKASGLENHPAIASLVQQTAKSVQPEVGPPSPYTYQNWLQDLEAEALQREEQKNLLDLQRDIQKEQIKRAIEDAAEEEKFKKQTERIKEVIDFFKSNFNFVPERISIAGVSFLSPQEYSLKKQQTLDNAFEKIDKYSKVVEDALNYRYKALDSLRRIMAGEANSTEQMLSILSALFSGQAGAPLIKSLAPQLGQTATPEAQARLLIPAINRILDNYYKRIRQYGIYAGIKPEEINQTLEGLSYISLDEITSILKQPESGAEEPVEKTDKSLYRAAVQAAEPERKELSIKDIKKEIKKLVSEVEWNNLEGLARQGIITEDGKLIFGDEVYRHFYRFLKQGK